MCAIQVSGITKRFGNVTAVDDLSFSVERGEVFGFLGPNGAGKSTVINVLLGYMSPTGGSATVLGYDIESESRKLRARTGVLPENIGIYDRLSGREHVESAIRIKRSDDDPDALLDRVGLDTDARDRPAGEYSTGMTQRLGLATALAGDPDLLIMDEPQSGLDPNGMQEVRSIVSEEASGGTTVFFSSHILSQVEAVSDRIGVMRAGQMVALDTPSSLRDQLGGDTSLSVQMATVPGELDSVTSIDGVEAVQQTGTEVQVTCTRNRAKARVIAELERIGDVRDFEVDVGSLEDSFINLTADASAGEQTVSSESPEPQEVRSQ